MLSCPVLFSLSVFLLFPSSVFLHFHFEIFSLLLSFHLYSRRSFSSVSFSIPVSPFFLCSFLSYSSVFLVTPSHILFLLSSFFSILILFSPLITSSSPPLPSIVIIPLPPGLEPSPQILASVTAFPLLSPENRKIPALWNGSPSEKHSP